MSRLKLIKVPSSVSVESCVHSGDSSLKILQVKGPLGLLNLSVTKDIDIQLSKDKRDLQLISYSNDKHSQIMVGTFTGIVKNMVVGVTKGFTINLNLVGLGYRVILKKDPIRLVFKLGYSHFVEFIIPENVIVKVIGSTTISLFSIDYQLITSVAAKIRNLKKPEPYKGKGIRYENEIISLKESKKK